VRKDCSNGVGAPSQSHSLVTKNSIPWTDIMNRVTNYYIGLKCYLKFYKIVADRMRSLNQLAIALNGVNYFSQKNIINYNINFSTLTDIISLVSSSFSKIHLTLSPLDSPNSSTISFGIVHLNEPDWRFA